MPDTDSDGESLLWGEEILLRYLYANGSVQAALPLRVVVDEPELLVAWLAPATPIMYWSTVDGLDPRDVPLDVRFRQELTTAARVWQGPGVLRAMPKDRPYQVLHFWDADGRFKGWYVNFEAPRVRTGSRLDSADWHLDLCIEPDLRPRWKDADEAAAALATPHLAAQDYALARATGEAIIDRLDRWPEPIGDWRDFRPDPDWRTPELPSDWASPERQPPRRHSPT